MAWLFEDAEFGEDITQWYGYIYMIENLLNGRKYIGRKYFTMAGYKQVKGKRKKIRKESDWTEYYGSSPTLLKDVETLGKENFKRTILKLCKGRGEVNYFEVKYIIEYDAVLRDDFYNEWIQCKIARSHVKTLWIS